MVHRLKNWQASKRFCLVQLTAICLIIASTTSFPFVDSSIQKRFRGGAVDGSHPPPRSSSSSQNEGSTDTEWGRISSFETDKSNNEMYENASTFQGYKVVDEHVEVAIVGGGLAGLALAIGLSRNNVPFKLYERAPKLRSISQGMLVVEVNGLRALRSIHPELPDRVLNSGRLMKSVDVTNIDINGNITSFVRASDIDEQRRKEFDGLAPVLIQWSNLQNVLASFIPNASDVICTGKSLINFVAEEVEDGVTSNTMEEGTNNDNNSAQTGKEQKRKGVVLLFEDGHVVRCNCLIGCDGTFSVVRRTMFHSGEGDNDDNTQKSLRGYYEAQRPISFGQFNWNAIIPQDSIPNKDMTIDNRASITMNYGKPTKWMAMMNDCGDGDRFWQLRVMDPTYAMNISKSDCGRGGLGLEGIKKSLLEAASPSEDICNIIRATPEEQIFERAIVGHTVAPTWCSPHCDNNVVLVGDAAHGVHPRVGQGANSAFESVSSLLHEMINQINHHHHENDRKDKEIDWAASFQQFEKHRKPRADIIQRYCNLVGCMQGMGLNTAYERDLTDDETKAFGDWIRRGNPNDPPPLELSELVASFDILKQPGVKRI